MALDITYIDEKIKIFMQKKYEALNNSLKEYFQFKNINIEDNTEQFTKHVINVGPSGLNNEIIFHNNTPIIRMETWFDTSADERYSMQFKLVEIWKNGL